MDDVEQEIDEELGKLNLDPCGNSSESEDENLTVLDETLYTEDISNSVLAYIEASRNRMNAFEQLIIEDVKETDSLCQESRVDHRTHEEAVDATEDIKKWKERVIRGLEEQVESQNDQMLNVDGTFQNDLIDNDICTESQLQLSIEWKELEKRLKEEEEQTIASQKLERELLLNSDREDEERRKRSLMEFEEQLRKVEMAAVFQNGEKNEILYTIDQHELDKQQELIRALEKELEDEKKAFEEAQEEERKRIHELRCRAATKIQAALRGTLVRRCRRIELKRKREEAKRLDEEKREWEKIKKEREEERRRIEEEKRFHREEKQRRRAEYEASKEQEHHRLEKEKRLEMENKEAQNKQMREMKEDKNIIMSVEDRTVKGESQCIKTENIDDNDESERKEEQNNITSIGERKVTGECQGLKTEKYHDDVDDESRKEMKKEREESNITSMGERRVREDSRLLETEKVLHQQRNKEEENEMGGLVKKKEDQSIVKGVDKRLVKEDSKVHKENVVKRIKEKYSRAESECQRKEKNEEKVFKSREEEREIKNEMERRKDDYNEKTVLKKDINKMDKNIKEERFDDQEVSRSFYQKQKKEEDLECQMNSLQSQKNLKPIKTPPPSDLNAHQELFLPNIKGHINSDRSHKIDTVKSLHGLEHKMDTRGHQNSTTVELENCRPENQESGSVCLPDSTEEKRLAWIKNCISWSILSLQNKKKRTSAKQQSRKRGARRGNLLSLPPLSVDSILKTGAWSSLKQVTTVTLEDLPGCNLSTLSQCNKLKTITLRRCGLTYLDGLNHCSQIRYIDVQENSIRHVDCGGLANLQVLLLGKNQLTNIHGLDDAENLQVLQLSHNNISRICGLGTQKTLMRLLVDHNQLLSTRGLNEMYTLLHLDCSYNHLSHIEGLENCALLNTLDLRGNSFTQLPVLHNNILLRDLFLDDNLISSIRDLVSYWLPLLQNLSLAHNSITELIPLFDLVSLRSLDISRNCLSDLQNFCQKIQGCLSLKELNLTDNPLERETNSRSLLLETVPGLIKLNNEQTSATAASSKGPRQQWSFQALCQAQQLQRDSLLQKHKIEISSAPSQHDAQLLASGHNEELFRLAVNQRFSHEYGDSCVTDDLASSRTLDCCQYKFSEALQWISPTKKPQHTADPKKSHCLLHTTDLQTDFPDSHTDRKTEKELIQTLNPKMAAVVIQRCWRRYVLQRHGGPSGLTAKITQRLHICRIKDSSIERPERPKSDRAAVVIQAAWRGYDLRRRLACAVAGVRNTESDEDFEEVDMDEFIFDEDKMEKDWITLNSNASLARAMPYSANSLLPKLRESPPVVPCLPKHAWSDREGAVCLEQSVSPHLNSCRFPKYSERSEKILKEWGITNDSTALLMLKRASKMKGKKPQQKRLLVSHQDKNEIQNAQRVKEPQNYKEKTHQWLHTQAVHPHTDFGDSGRDHFLPEIDREILYSGRVQLVASAGGRSAVDSKAKLWVNSTGVSPPLNRPTRARRHSTEHEKTQVPSPNRISSAPSQKERISFRDSPVRQSGGWGGGKKRTK